MSAAAVKALMMLLKKIAVDVLSDPEKLLKYILIFAIVFISVVVIILSPIIFTVSLPTVLFQIDGMPVEMLQEQTEVIELYKEIPILVDKENIKWIESQKTRYSWCDDIVVNNDFNLIWYELMAIDTVRLEQDFTKAKKNDILGLANEFLIKNTYTTTYEDTVTSYRKKKDANGKDVLDKNGNPVMEPYPDTVTRDRAYISISVRELEDVLEILKFNNEKKDIIKTIYANIKSVEDSGSFDYVNWGT